MIVQVAVALTAGLLGWAYLAIKPPPPKICGSPGGPPVTSPRIQLSDGRHLAYKEKGVPKEEAQYKIIAVHGYDSSKDLDLPVSQELIEELRIYLLFFDRAGYGESDPYPERSVKSEALDIQELADKLHIGSKFYVIGVSLGALLAGASLVVPFVHYWWRDIPANISREAFNTMLGQDQWTFRIAHYAPWLFNWWMTQKWFPSLSMMAGNMTVFSDPDLEILKELSKKPSVGQEKIRQQGMYESLFRDIVVAYGNWEFGPLDLPNPFPENEGSVHIWQGYDDKIIPRQLNRYISEKLPWIRYHELETYCSEMKNWIRRRDFFNCENDRRGMFTEAVAVLWVGVLLWAFQAIRSPPPKICGSKGGPKVTSPRIKLSDGRHLAYKVRGVPKEKAKYKELIDELGIFIVTYDRAGYGDSDPNPKRSVKSEAYDVEELADQIQLGQKFYVLGVSIGTYTTWACLKFIPHRHFVKLPIYVWLAGAALIVPAINFWWPSFPSELCESEYKKQPKKDQWKLRISHYVPGLLYWWMTQKWFPSCSIMARDPIIFNKRDFEILKKMLQVPNPNEHKIRQQGEYESLFKDLMVGFGSWEFDPMELENPFPHNEGVVQLWQGREDKLVPVELQRFVAEKLPWIKYHEVPDGGHLIIHDNGLCESIFKSLLLKQKPTFM
ncbi:hypothetical protein RHSIM_Rhsim13G0110800 [Rhododendron simsii]|uniref:AB hydrolase-1 domain-containing protein n=1 Tax=Rhododendron simsii TaxID=118357 RepID=A0A834FXH5_RHOSS|nr:hypothetical protein RHSIM_Rhsim13G0110800 [Rhododendron simsii]